MIGQKRTQGKCLGALANRDGSEQVTQTKTQRPTWREEDVEDPLPAGGNVFEGPGTEMEDKDKICVPSLAPPKKFPGKINHSFLQERPLSSRSPSLAQVTRWDEKGTESSLFVVGSVAAPSPRVS